MDVFAWDSLPSRSTGLPPRPRSDRLRPVESPGSTDNPEASPARRTVVFDLGGVLVDWDPRYLYRRVIEDEAEMEAVLADVCPPEWDEPGCSS